MLIDKIASDTGLNRSFIDLVVRTASYRYKTYTIPKKKGGYRQIDHPARELKLLQRWLLDNVIAQLPVHECAFGYRKGRNIRLHALCHVGNNFLLRVDFRDFFPSITADDILTLMGIRGPHLRGDALTAEDHEVVARLVCRRGRLTIGAPTSPAISNAVMYEFDAGWSGRCAGSGVSYTRYADDLCFSTNEPGVLSQLLGELKADLLQRRPLLTLNDAKTVFTSRKRHRAITGVVLTPDRKVSLGRARKRRVRTLVHLYAANRLEAKDREYLRGFVAFASSIEPEFVESLRRKFGEDLLHSLLARLDR